ncbi:TetR/AcrR family transcriptional regulator [Paenibacillus sp. YN15]|uniref:TetR/AcrR family transcriptional regulator n=1 Tax=Paenibacillus sp. YN15 TaxID=1742774 RepID=UPI000DCF20C4|nr:TetR-like C-terminal domain-containing protein [Paenibacillus sp. YN15]RAV01947.1 TetR/AcrR family transcriptional regulator [Paenibacillus sp. YN15]
MKEMKLDRKTRYTRMVLQDSLMELMKDKPINKITIKELCEHADLNRTTFYAHYTDQYDLLRKIGDEALAWAKEAVAILIEKTDERETMKVLESICHYFAQNSKHLQILMSEQGDMDFQKELLTLIYQQCGISTLAENGGDRAELYFRFVVMGSVGLIQHWLKTGLKQPPEEIAGIIYDMAALLR